MLTVSYDARDAYAAPLRGWGRYAREILEHLPDEIRAVAHREPGRGPEVIWEQVGWPAELRRLGPDVAHAPNCFLPLRRSCPGVVTVHDLAFEEFPEDFSRRTGAKYRWFAPRCARSAQRVICVSEFTAADVERRYGVDRARIRVVPNAPSLAVGDAEPPAGPYLLAVGDLRAKKNLDRLVAAWRASGVPHRLVLAGAGKPWDALLDPRVEVTGYVSEGRLDALMRGADLLVHPSLHEGFGLVVLEAMARGTPVAAARATALPETAGGAAELFDPLDVVDMSAAIARALGRREELARLGRARAAEFSWERSAAMTAEVYREAAGA
jgi:glycosyltransferase involved in cell wall biosynthesis